MHFYTHGHIDNSYRIVLVTQTEDGILLSQKAKNPHAPVEKNRAWTTLNAIKLGIEKNSHFMSEKNFGTEEISAVANHIYVRYEKRYYQSFWNRIVDTIASCFGIKSDLKKIQELVDEILRHPEVKINPINPTLDESEDDSMQLSGSEESRELDNSVEVEHSKEEASDQVSDQQSVSQSSSEVELEENICSQFERSDEHLLEFLSKKVFLVQPRTPNHLTIEFLEGLTELQIKRLVELNKKGNFLEKLLESICVTIAEGTKKFLFEAEQGPFALFRAIYQADPESELWEKFQRNPYLLIPIAAQRTIAILNSPLQVSISDDDQKLHINAIRSSFKSIEHCMHPTFEVYTHSILSHIITLNESEGSEVAQIKLKLFIKAIVPSDHKDVEHTHTFNLISRAVHLDKDPISECCKHLPITPDFKLTPIVLKTLIAEYAKNQSHWNYYVMHRIDTKDQALVLLEAALELPEKQQSTLLSAIYHSIYKRDIFQVLFEEKGLKTENYPALSQRAYNELFTPNPFQLYDFSKEFVLDSSEENDL